MRKVIAQANDDSDTVQRTMKLACKKRIDFRAKDASRGVEDRKARECCHNGLKITTTYKDEQKPRFRKMRNGYTIESGTSTKCTGTADSAVENVGLNETQAPFAYYYSTPDNDDELRVERHAESMTNKAATTTTKTETDKGPLRKYAVEPANRVSAISVKGDQGQPTREK